MVQSDANKRIQDAAQKFLAFTSKIARPTHGEVADFMDGMPPKGLNAALRAIGEAIGNLEDMATQSANKELLGRLRELCEVKVRDTAGYEKLDPYNPTDALLAVAYPTGENGVTQENIQKLRAAFKHNGRSIFDEMLRMLGDIDANKELEIESGKDNIAGDDRADKPTEDTLKGWRKSLKDDDRPAVDDQSIRDSAAQFDKDKPPVSDKEIQKSAAGENEFKITDEHRTEYERTEGDDGDKYIRQLSNEQSELGTYRRLCRILKSEFDKTLGACLEPAGVSPKK